MYETKQKYFDKKLVTLGSFLPLCSSSCPCVSSILPSADLSPIISPFLFSHHFCSLSFIMSEASRGYQMSAGVIQRHLFSSSSGKSSSPLIVCNSSSPKIFYKSTLTGNYHCFPSRLCVLPRTTVTPSLCASYLYYRLPITILCS